MWLLGHVVVDPVTLALQNFLFLMKNKLVRDISIDDSSILFWIFAIFYVFIFACQLNIPTMSLLKELKEL